MIWDRHKRSTKPEPSPLSEQEQQITIGLESLRESTVREIMTPRVDVVAIPAPVRFGDVAGAVRRSGYSHFPVYEGDLDHLLGVLFAKDLFHLDQASTSEPRSDNDSDNQGRVDLDNFSDQAVPTGQRGGISSDLDVTKRLREPYIVPESRSALQVLADMRRRRRGFAVVVDEYGGLAGVLTVNDLVSQIVGDLRDEFDRERSPSIVRIDTQRFLVDGSCSVDDVRSGIGIDVPDGEYVTLGGYLFDAFGKIPSEGEVIEREGWKLRVTRMDRRRIAKVVIEAPSATITNGVGSNRSTNGK